MSHIWQISWIPLQTTVHNNNLVSNIKQTNTTSNSNFQNNCKLILNIFVFSYEGYLLAYNRNQDVECRFLFIFTSLVNSCLLRFDWCFYSIHSYMSYITTTISSSDLWRNSGIYTEFAWVLNWSFQFAKFCQKYASMFLAKPVCKCMKIFAKSLQKWLSSKGCCRLQSWCIDSL